MPLTAEEREMVIGWLEEYPAGVPPDAWGHSKEFLPENGILGKHPAKLPASHCKKYG